MAAADGNPDGRWTARHQRPRIVLFDLDGTLSDSARGILASLRHAFDVNGLTPLDPQVERALLGPPFYESLPPLIGTAVLGDVIRAYREHYGAIGMFDTQPYEGMREVLDALRRRGAVLAVATSKPEPYAVPIVEFLGIADRFATVGGDELDGSLPTKALVIDKVLGRLGRPDPAEVLMVGDRVHDIDGAREHGIDAVGAGWGYAVPGELDAAAPALVCATPAALGRALDLDIAAAPNRTSS
ncbi:MAG: phosphoglycolate phosphatase [Pseudonocardiales bacterium]|nr:phosphoglycolate phosphatase [Pseudonocardiales bacterium]